MGSNPTPGTVAQWDDEDDWVGEPPEGRYTRDRADPAFWARRPPASFVAAGIGLVLIVILVAYLVS